MLMTKCTPILASIFLIMGLNRLSKMEVGKDLLSLMVNYSIRLCTLRGPMDNR
jgi:hypothetical protein